MANIAIVYVGPHLAVDVESGEVAERDKPIEVEASVAKRLLEQKDTWAEATPKAAPAPKKENA